MTQLEVIAENRSGNEVLAQARAMVEPALHVVVDRLPDSMRRIAGYHFGWLDEHGRSTGLDDGGDRGKGIRPALVLLAAQTVGGSAPEAVPAACAIELVHNFSLLHDDVMDGDLTRRHRATSWTVFGVNSAILAGDALLTLAFDVLADGSDTAAGSGRRMLCTALMDLVDGQSADLAFEGRADVGLSECVRMAAGKTGALLGCACGVGAAIGGGDPDRIEHLRAFGEHLGIAFQLVDDLLGIWGDPSVTGKPIHSDLARRKKSLPVVAALTSGTPAGYELADLYHTDTLPSTDELAHVAHLIETAGGRAWAQDRADEHLNYALARLRAADPDPRAAAELHALAGLAVHRDH